MAKVMSDVTEKVSDTFDNVRHRIGARRRRNMLAERWPLIALGAVLLAGLAAGIAFAVTQRRSMDMNAQLDEMLSDTTYEDVVI